MSAKEEQQKIEPIKENSPTQSNTSKMALIAFFVSFLSLLAFIGFYLYFSNEKQKLNDNLDLLEKNNQHQFSQLQENMSKQWSVVNQEVQNTLRQQKLPNSHWLLLKARYYLQLAQIQAHWSNSQALIQALLQEANQSLAGFHEPEILNIRQAIAKDIAHVQSLKTVDIAGILSQIDGIQKNIEQLKILNPSRFKNAPATTSSTTAWQNHLKNSFERLSQLIVIRHQDEQIEPVISPLLESILKEKILLNLQQAQWAVLHENEAVYQLVLKQALTTVQKNFGNQEALVEQFHQLLALPIQQKPISIGQALPLINDWIQKKESTIEGDSSQ